ncbi:MAG: hypothetical protein H0T11_03390 [Chthoniobacterales bacterium]|nr:hypothetical protein [Chthoniobacterales bacterium]
MNRFISAAAAVTIIATLVPKIVAAQTESQGVGASSAARIFEEAKEICRKDDGALWGVSLCGPILLVE